MWDRGFFLSLEAIRRQLAVMPCPRYLLRLIHHHTRKALPGERLWTAAQLTGERTVRFLRARNREGYDVYFRPYAATRNAGYILLDLDRVEPGVLSTMRSQGHEPCAVIETSPGHRQCWIRVSAQPLPATVAREIGRHLARLYQGDLASTDGRHLGRLAGFTNQKPHRRLPCGGAPWVKLRQATLCLSSHARSLLEAAGRALEPTTMVSAFPRVAGAPASSLAAGPSVDRLLPVVTSEHAAAIYQTWVHRLRIPQRFPHPDWSIVDLWIAQELLSRGTPAGHVISILRLASPQFPRRHAEPEDYLRRTLARATRDPSGPAFPARSSPVQDS